MISTWSPGLGGHDKPQPEPAHCVNTGNQPVNTPSGCSSTFAVAVVESDDETMPIRGCADVASTRLDARLTKSKNSFISRNGCLGRSWRGGRHGKSPNGLSESTCRRVTPVHGLH